MADSFVRVPADSVGKRVDASSLDVGADTVYRQRIVIGDNAATAEFATVTGGILQVGGSFTLTGTATVAGNVNISATAVVSGNVNISTMPAVVLAAGTNNFGTLNNISRTVTVVGVVALTAGTAVIGDLNAISRTVQVAVGTPFVIQGISTTVQVAVGTPFTVNNISATVVVAGSVVISGTATAIIGGFLDPSGNQRNVVDSANTALRVNVVAGSSGGVSQVDGTTFSTQAANFVPIGGIFDDASTDTLSENDAGVVRMTTNRGIHVNLRTDGGTAMDDSANSALRVNVVAGGAGGGAVFGEVAHGASLSTTNKPVLMGGNDSAGGGVARTLLLDTSGRVILGAGSSVIGVLDSISATVGVKGQVSLGAGTSNIGFINNISATVIVAMSNQTLQGISTTVQVAIGTPYILQGISTTVQVAIATPYTIQAISTTVTVAGNVNISTMPAITINGGVAHSASVTAGVIPVITGLRAGTSASAAVAHRDATYAWGDKFGRQVVVHNHPSLLPTASHGPKCVTASTSAGVALVAAPGAGNSIFITQLACTNGSGTLTRADVFAASATASCIAQMYMAASGGGFVMKYDPPIQVLSNTGVTCRVDPNVSQAIFNVHFYVGPK